MSLFSILLDLAQGSLSQRVLEGCKNACQYAVDRLQLTLNSVTNWLGLVLIAIGLLSYFIWALRQRPDVFVHKAPPNYHLWKIPAAFAAGVTLLRFILEQFSSLESVAQVIGIGWLPVPFGIYFAWKALRLRELLANLALFIWAARVPVVVIMILSSYLNWGTHYDISHLTRLDTQCGRLNYEANSFKQHLHIIYLAQLVIMPIYNFGIGLLVGAPLFFLKAIRNRYQAKSLKRIAISSR